MLPDVTIVTPFRNPGSYFELALKSIFAQTLTNWELILIDDGSRDASLSFARSLRDPRVRVFSDGRRRHQQVRRNEAIALASAPYIALMDADDIMHPRLLEAQLAELRSAQSGDAPKTTKKVAAPAAAEETPPTA